MKVLADTAVRHDDAAMEEDQVRLDRVGTQHNLKVHGASPIMDRFEMVVFGGIATRNAVLDVARCRGCLLLRH